MQLNNDLWEAAQNGYVTLSPAGNLDPKDITADTPKFMAEYAKPISTVPNAASIPAR